MDALSKSASWSNHIQVAHLAFVAVLVAAAMCIITSHIILYKILSEVNSVRSPEQQFSFLFVGQQIFVVMGEHARLFPESRKREYFYLLCGIAFALILSTVFFGSIASPTVA